MDTDKDGTPLSRREKVSLTALTVGSGLLGGLLIFRLPIAARAFGCVAVILVLQFVGPGTWFALFGRFTVRGPDRQNLARGSVGLLNLAAMIVALVAFWFLSSWRKPWD